MCKSGISCDVQVRHSAACDTLSSVCITQTSRVNTRVKGGDTLPTQFRPVILTLETHSHPVVYRHILSHVPCDFSLHPTNSPSIQSRQALVLCLDVIGLQLIFVSMFKISCLFLCLLGQEGCNIVTQKYFSSSFGYTAPFK